MRQPIRVQPLVEETPPELPAAVAKEGAAADPKVRELLEKLSAEARPEPVESAMGVVLLKGRVARARGTHFGGRAFTLSLWNEDGLDFETFDGLLDAEGGFEIDTDGKTLGRFRRREKVVLRILPGPEGPEGWFAEDRLPTRYENGVIDLGSLHPKKPRFPIVGVVMDEAGHAVSGAKVDLWMMNRRETLARDLPGHTAQTDAKGRFALFGLRDLSQKLFFQVDSPGHALAELTEPGSRRLRRFFRGRRRGKAFTVPVVRAGACTARLELPVSLQPKVRVFFEGECVPADRRIGQGREPDSWRWEVRPDSEGRLDWPRLLPGVGRVVITSTDEETVYGTREGCLITAGRQQDLGVIDVSDRLGYVTIRVQDGEQKPIAGALIRTRGADRVEKATTGADGEARLLYAAHPLDLVIEAGDFAVYRSGGVIGDRTVTLLPAVAVRLDLSKGAELLPDDDHVLEVEVLQPKFGVSRGELPYPVEWWAHPVKLEAKKSASLLELSVSTPGQYRVRYALRLGTRTLPLGDDLFIATGGRSEPLAIAPVLKALQSALRELHDPSRR